MRVIMRVIICSVLVLISFVSARLYPRGQPGTVPPPPPPIETYCSPQYPPVNGHLTGACSTGRRVAAGQECYFHCKTGYKLAGFPTAYCQYGGIWSIEAPTCKPIVRCPELHPPERGGYTGNCTQAINGQSCVFVCQPGHTLDGQQIAYCDGGRWTSKTPTCVEEERPAPVANENYRKSDYRVRMEHNWILPSTASCSGAPLYGVEWVLSVRNSDYGWEDQTHRAIVVLELNNYRGSTRKQVALKEKTLMRKQLEVEVTKALYRNTSSNPLEPSEIGLFIQALLATGRDPAEFYGLDLVKILEYRIRLETKPSPSAVLALCSANAIAPGHLNKISIYLRFPDKPCSHQIEFAAIALKAFACAAKLNAPYRGEMQNLAANLVALQKPDGSFGNVYTTALIIQALKTYNYTSNWNERNAINFLLSKRTENVNMLSTYFIELALHAPRGLFNDVLQRQSPYTGPDGFVHIRELLSWPRKHFIQYTLRIGEAPDFTHSVTIKIPENITFFDVMRIAAHEHSKFSFSYHLDNRPHSSKRGQPTIYIISGIPNDAENGQYWRLVRENGVRSYEITRSPILEPTDRDTHFVYWYYDVFKNIRGLK